MKLPDFAIQAKGPVSLAFLQKGLDSFAQAAAFVKTLPYGRNVDKSNILCVLADNVGTCSTKHALLQNLANENGIANMQLVLGIFAMDAINTPPIAPVLQQYRLTYIPEAHSYLRYEAQIIDCTAITPIQFEESLLEETTIAPHQITDFKVNWHRAYLQKWLAQHTEIPYTVAELWDIREYCIKALSGL